MIKSDFKNLIQNKSIPIDPRTSFAFKVSFGLTDSYITRHIDLVSGTTVANCVTSTNLTHTSLVDFAGKEE